MDKVRTSAQTGLRIRGCPYLISLTYIRNSNRNIYGKTRNACNGNRCTLGQDIVQDWPRGYPPCHISLFFALLFAFLDRARLAETYVSVSIRMESGVLYVHL